MFECWVDAADFLGLYVTGAEDMHLDKMIAAKSRMVGLLITYVGCPIIVWGSKLEQESVCNTRNTEYMAILDYFRSFCYQ